MIDFKYAQDLLRKLTGEVMKRESGYRGSIVSDFDNKREELAGTIIFKFWDNLLSNCGAFEGETLTQSEKALACLVRKGVDINSIKRKGTTSYVTLKALTYRVSKEGVGFSSVPCVHTGTMYGLPMRWISLSGEDFADFMFDFDSIVGSVYRAIDNHLLEEKALAMQYSIIRQSVDTLGEQFLKPHGITWRVADKFTDSTINVNFFQKGRENIRETIELDRLPDVIAGIPERMESQPELKTDKDLRLGRLAWKNL